MKAVHRKVIAALFFVGLVQGAFCLEDKSYSYNASVSTSVAEAASLWESYDILAYYGHPSSQRMGILGRHPINELYEKLSLEADNYAAVSEGRPIKKAFYIIYGTVWPEGEIGIISDKVLLPWIEFAAKNDMLVFLDHQIGKYDPVASLARMLPYLKYPNVHLALDPEWRTTKPMEEIGSVRGEELNRAQEAMQKYMIDNNIEGERLLVVHQFNAKMILGRPTVRSDFERVRLVHCADGFGPPSEKIGTYAYNAQASNMPFKAFKLFYKSEYANAGYDNPLLSPKDVYALNPRPRLIIYQ